MNAMRARSSTLAVLAGASALLGCATPGSGGGPARVPVEPRCALHAVTLSDSPLPNARVPVGGIALVTERVDPRLGHGFEKFRGLRGPRGNSAAAPMRARPKSSLTAISRPCRA